MPQTSAAVVETKGKGRLATFAALSSPNYLIFWLGSLVAIIGWQVQYLAQGWLVYRLSDSPLYLGLVGLSSAVPTIALTLFGGVLADRVNRLKLLIYTQLAYAILALALATLTVTGLVEVWHILVIAFANGAVMAFDQPSRQALIPALVERKNLMNAIALNSAAWQVSRIVGPSLGGLLVGLTGEAACFYVTSGGFLMLAGALALVRVESRAPGGNGRGMWHNLTEGLRYIAHTPLFTAIISLTFLDSIFGTGYVTLMPVFARDILAVGAQGMGLLMTASGLGALVATIVIASLGNFRRRGWLLLYGLAGFSLLLFAFALSSWFQLSLALLAGMGFHSSLYMVTANTTLQSEVPDELRGRVMGVYGLTWSLMPLGGLVAGSVATVTSAPFAIGLGATVVAAFAVGVGLFAPLVRRLS